MTNPPPAPPNLTCDNPKFSYNPATATYGPCTTCDRTAWSHNGADILADMNLFAEWMLTGAKGNPPPPVVRPG